MVKEVNMDQLQKDAVDIFTSGFACSESVIFAIRKHFEIDLSDDAIAMSSGFPWGLGGGGCICGALAGGTMMIGYFFGRKTNFNKRRRDYIFYLDSSYSRPCF